MYQYVRIVSRGLFITIHDKGHIYEILNNWPEHEIKASEIKSIFL